MNSRRLDVAPGDPEGVPDPKRLNEYLNLQKEENWQLRTNAIKFAKKLLK